MTTTFSETSYHRRGPLLPPENTGLGDGIQSLDTITTGFDLGSIQRLFDTKVWFRWYRNDLRGLWGQPTAANGLIHFARGQEDVLRLPMFPVISDFYGDTILAYDTPMISPDEGLNAWLAVNKPQVYRALIRALHFWAVAGRLLLMVDREGLTAVRPDEHLFVTAADNAERVIGHVLVYPYYSTRLRGQIGPIWQSRDPDRIKVVKLPQADGPVSGTVQHFEFARNVIGAPIGPPQTTGAAGLYWAGNGKSIYPDIQDMVGQVCVEFTQLFAALGRASNPHLVLPDSIAHATFLPPQDLPTPENPNPPAPVPATLAEIPSIRNRLATGTSTVIEVAAETTEGAAQYLQIDPQVEGHVLAIENLLTLIYVGSGVPPTSFGGAYAGKGESGEARKQAMQRSAQLVAEMRAEIERIAPLVVSAMGAPVPTGDGAPSRVVDFNWIGDPFSDTEDMLNLVDKLISWGVVDNIWAAEQFGIPVEVAERATQAREREREQEMEQRGLMSRTRGMLPGGNRNGNRN